MITLKRLLVCLCISLSVSQVCAQIAVADFRLLENEISANIEGPNKQIDQNGEVAALIKVQTTEKGFIFEGGLLGIVDTKQDVGEVYVWVPRSAKRVTIKHPTLGVLRNYAYPIPIESGRTYEMVLTTGTVKTIVEQSFDGNYLVMNVTPPNAEIFIEGELQTTTEADGKAQISNHYQYGEYSYQVSAPLYETETGVFTINSNDDGCKLNINLKPAYSQLQITSTPAGAMVYIDDAAVAAGKTPFTTERLSRGNHTLKFQYSSYKTKTIEVDVVGDGGTQSVSASLDPNFAAITLTVENNAEIYIDNNKLLGRGQWTGNLNAGTHIVEARKASHYPSKQKIEVEAGIAQQIALKAPVPQYGKLSINTIPTDAIVELDGKVLGNTPKNFSDILVGTYVLAVKKSGYATVEDTITIEEGKITQKSYTMESGGTVIIESPVPLAKVYVEGVYKGVAPYTLSGKSGYYNIRVSAEGYKDAEGVATIVAGQTNRKSFKPISLTGGVAIYSNASGASITIDGVYKGSAPYSFTGTPGTYEVEVSASGYKSKKQKIQVIAGNVNSVTVTLDHKRVRTKPQAIKNLSYMDTGDWFSVGGGWDILWTDNMSMGGFLSFKIGQEQYTWLTGVINIGGYKMGKTESGMFFLEEGDPTIDEKNAENARTTYVQVPLQLALRLRVAGGEWVDSKTAYYVGVHGSYNFNLGDNVDNGMVHKSNYSIGGHIGLNVARIFEFNITYTHDLKPAYDQEYIYLTNPEFYAEKESRINRRWRIGTSLVFYIPFSWNY